MTLSTSLEIHAQGEDKDEQTSEPKFIQHKIVIMLKYLKSEVLFLVGKWNAYP